MREHTGEKPALVILLVIAVVVLAGCSTTSGAASRETARDTVRAHDDFAGSWSPGPGCCEKVTGYAYNAADTIIENVALNPNFVNSKTGAIRDSRSVFTGTMGAGQSVTHEFFPGGECTQEYKVDAAIVRYVF